MRIRLEMVCEEGELVLPVHYNSYVQGLIYANLDEFLARRVHNSGMPLGKRQFRFFTFSRVLGNYHINGETIRFKGPVRLHIGSVHEELLESLVKHLLTKEEVVLGGQRCRVHQVEVEGMPILKRPILVRTLSPITTYSTLIMGNGIKKTYYYCPMEREWEKKILDNLRRKACALGWSDTQIASLEGAHIRPVRVKKRDLQIVKYRGTVIKGWTGIYELDLPEPFFLLAYDAGLGSKNSQGFGMVEVIDAAEA